MGHGNPNRLLQQEEAEGLGLGGGPAAPDRRRGWLIKRVTSYRGSGSE